MEVSLFVFTIVLVLFILINIIKLIQDSDHNTKIQKEATRIREIKEDSAIDKANKRRDKYRDIIRDKDNIIFDLDNHVKFMEKILTGQDKLEDYKYYKLNNYGHITFFKED